RTSECRALPFRNCGLKTSSSYGGRRDAGEQQAKNNREQRRELFALYNLARSEFENLGNRGQIEIFPRSRVTPIARDPLPLNEKQVDHILGSTPIGPFYTRRTQGSHVCVQPRTFAYAPLQRRQ